jgi:hypothetical protein
MFHKSNLVSIDKISENTLIISDGHDYLSFKDKYKQNILFIKDTFITRENIVNATLYRLTEQDWFKYNFKSNIKLYQRIQPNVFNNSMNQAHFKMFMDVLNDKDEKLFNKYIYSIIQSSINLYKHAGLIKQGSLSIDKERVYKFFRALNYNNLNKKGFETVLKNFEKSKYYKRSNKDKIELSSINSIYSDDTIFHSRTLHKNKKFTINDYKKLAIEILFSSPVLENKATPIEYTTTLKKIGELVGLKPCTINYHTRKFLKLIKYQFITKEEHNNLLRLKKEDPNMPYSFIVYTNQKEMQHDKNGEFKNNTEYYLTPIGSRLFTNKKFKSLDRTGEVNKTQFLEFKKRTREKDDFNQSFVHLTNNISLVNLMDNIERQKDSQEKTSSDSIENSNVFEIDYNKQIQIVYKDFNSAKGTVQQIVALLGMIKNLSSCDINIPDFNWNQKLHKLDRLIRFFAKRMLDTQVIDDDLLKENLKTFRYIMIRTRALQGSSSNISKHEVNVKNRKLRNNVRDINLETLKYDSNAFINELFSSFFNKDNNTVGLNFNKLKFFNFSNKINFLLLNNLKYTKNKNI